MDVESKMRDREISEALEDQSDKTDVDKKLFLMFL